LIDIKPIEKTMNKGLAANFYATLLFLVTILILVIGNEQPLPNEVRYILSAVYTLIQMGIGMLGYLSGWYKEDYRHSDFDRPNDP
jgi:hypothetical protein